MIVERSSKNKSESRKPHAMGDFSDKAILNLAVHINRHNSHYLSDETPYRTSDTHIQNDPLVIV
jgi:hypothetical protein